MDQKIEEIIGLNKGQFMQVGMIAQGEFMEVLRAKSDEKKKIFQGYSIQKFMKNCRGIGTEKKENESEMEKVRMPVKQMLPRSFAMIVKKSVYSKKK